MDVKKSKATEIAVKDLINFLRVKLIEPDKEKAMVLIERVVSSMVEDVAQHLFTGGTDITEMFGAGNLVMTGALTDANSKKDD